MSIAISPPNSLPLRSACPRAAPARRSASSTSPIGQGDLRLGVDHGGHPALVAGLLDLVAGVGGELAGPVDLAGGEVGEGEVVLDPGRLEDRPGGAIEGHALRAGPDRRLEVADLAVVDGQVEEERGTPPVVEIGGEAPRLLEVRAARAVACPARDSTAASEVSSRISKSGSTCSPPRTCSSSAVRTLRASTSLSDW